MSEEHFDIVVSKQLTSKASHCIGKQYPTKIHKPRGIEFEIEARLKLREQITRELLKERKYKY